MGPHQTPYQGVPLHLDDPAGPGRMPDLVSFYRWHLPDPVVFERTLRVTIQQLGAVMVPHGGDELGPPSTPVGSSPATAGRASGDGPVEWFAVCERIDDYCATAFVMCHEVQAVPRVDVGAAIADVERFPYEQRSPFEGMLDDGLPSASSRKRGPGPPRT